MSDEDFVFTDARAKVSNNLWMITSAVGACLCFLVLVMISIVAIHPVSRPHLDRVSFRILVYALIANTAFGIVNAIGGSFTGPTWACGFAIWILQLTLELSCFLLMCIAINLQLVVVHQVDGKKMEKFYVCGSVAISLILTIPPYAAGQYGWDVLEKDCWYTNDDLRERLAWQIGTQVFWTFLTVLGEVISTSTVILFMIKHQVYQKHNSVHSNSPRSDTSTSQHVQNAKKYRGVLLRVALYPTASCLFTLTSVATVLYSTGHVGIHTWTGYHVLLLSDFLYGGRAIVYALIAATDPSLLRAWRALLHRNRYSQESSIVSRTENSRRNTAIALVDLKQSKDANSAYNLHSKKSLHISDEGELGESPPEPSIHIRHTSGLFERREHEVERERQHIEFGKKI